MKKYQKARVKLINLVKFIGLFAIAFLLLTIAFRGIKFQSIVEQISHAKLFWVLLSVFFSVVALFSRSYRWNLLLEPMGYYPSLQKTFYALMTGYLANLAFPRLGEVTRCGSLSKTQSIPFNVLLGTVIIERIIDVISLLICLLITTVIEIDRLGNFLNSGIIKPVLYKLQKLGSSPIIMIAVLILFLSAFFVWRKKGKGLIGDKMARLVNGVVEGIKSVGKLKRPWLFVFHSVFIWFLYYASVYVALFAMPSTERLGSGAALFLLVAAGVAMSAPVQGGIGAYHLLVSKGLMLFGLTQQNGLAFATMLHGLQTILIIVFGAVSFLLFFINTNKEKVSVKRTDLKLKAIETNLEEMSAERMS